MKQTNKKLSAKQQAEQSLVEEVRADFFARQQARRAVEAQWELNLNFYSGNQHCLINGNKEVETLPNRFFWQEHQVFNHIAPVVERRLSKLARIRPKMSVFPASTDEMDLKSANVSKKIINSVYNTEDMNKIISEVTRWSEICGTGFYKVLWNSAKGDLMGKSDGLDTVRSGDVEIIAVSPFEIFPDNPQQTLIENQRSIIHAKAYHIEEIKNRWGVEVDGEGATLFTLGQNERSIKSENPNFALVIERYEAPNLKFPNGRLVMVAGNKLLHVGELPYLNGTHRTRVFPFVKQDSLVQTGGFWGGSVVTRLIPLQISYNAIKNRKHEFINRLSMGVLTVEDGSLDIEALEEEGLCPGKVLVYRQGADKPNFMETDRVPYDFIKEEQALVEEFANLGGVSDFNNENYITKGLSGTALAMMIEQDESKMLMTNDSVKTAIKTVAKHILRLYKQFAKIPKLTKLIGDNGKMELFYFSASDIASDDVVFETKDEYSDSFAQRKEMILTLIDKGIFNDENGKMPARTKMKILELLGYAIIENAEDLTEKHTQKADEENFMFMRGEAVKISPIDDHALHINQHISFMLSGEFNKIKAFKPSIEKEMLKHIEEHKNNLKNN